MTVRLRLPVDDPRSVGTARQALDGLTQYVTRDVVNDVRLLVSELVTNALRHADRAGTWVLFSAAVAGGVVRVEVCDAGSGFDATAPAVPTADQSSGWGLYLVDRIADRWGLDRGEGRFCVWFEIALVRSVDGLGAVDGQTAKRTWRTSPSRTT